MKKILLIVTVLLIAGAVQAQKIPSVPTMPDINKLLNMTPAERETYKKQVLNKVSKQVKEKAQQHNLKINEMTLPDFELKMPVKDVKRLALLPSQPPAMVQLMEDLKKSKQQVEQVAAKEILGDVAVLTGSMTAGELQAASIESFYNDKPVHALLLSMESLLKNNREVIAWNNLSSIYNMTGLQHKAIPILMHHLQNLPTNPMLLNNMGQAYFGLGDIPSAKDYLNKCLLEDPLHPEANRSMGIICLLQNDEGGAREHLEKEMQVTQRESTVSLAEKNNFSMNVYLIRNKRKAIPNHNYFDDIQLGKFKVPDFPESSDKSRVMTDKASEMLASITNEMLFWGNESTATPEMLAIEGKEPIGLYRKQVDRLWKDLHKAYTPYDLALFNDVHINQMKAMFADYAEKMAAVKCPQPPAGASMEVTLAYQKKCCDIKKPIIDAFMAQHNAFVRMRINQVSGIYKQYINDLCNILSIDPTPANRRLACSGAGGYLNMLYSGWMAGQFIDAPEECHCNISSQEADSIIQSNRNINLKCPDGLKLNLDFKMISLKADCKTYSLSGKYGMFRGKYSHSFQTGTSTLSAGVGLSANFFKGFGNAGITQMAYVSWDANNNFTDLGLSGKASMGIDGNIAGIDAEYSLGISSGWNSNVTPKSIFSQIQGLFK